MYECMFFSSNRKVRKKCIRSCSSLCEIFLTLNYRRHHILHLSRNSGVYNKKTNTKNNSSFCLSLFLLWCSTWNEQRPSAKSIFYCSLRFADCTSKYHIDYTIANSDNHDFSVEKKYLRLTRLFFHKERKKCIEVKSAFLRQFR